MDENAKNACSSDEGKKQTENNKVKSGCNVSEDEKIPEAEDDAEDEAQDDVSQNKKAGEECDDGDNPGQDNLNESEEKESKDDVIKEMFKGNKKLSGENEKLNNEIDALKDRLLRMTAEYDNFRKRTAKEKEGIYTDACEDVLKNILPVLDNLERADKADGSLEDLKKGVEMTVKQFEDSLSKLGVEEICTDCEFDPNMHHAVMHVEDKDYKKNQIVEVFQKGYKKGKKVLRYSMVKVAN